jgi:ribonuclease R
MAKKRKSSKKPFSRTPTSNQRKQGKSKKNFPKASPRLRNTILAHLYKHQSSFSLDDMTKEFASNKTDRKRVVDELYELARSGWLQLKGKKHFSLNTKAKFFSGKLEINPKGFGFVSVDSQPGDKVRDKDIFISKYNLSGASHNDYVLVLLEKDSKPDRPEGTVITVLESAPDTISGFYQQINNKAIVIPEDPRYPFQVAISGKLPDNLQINDAVIVQLEKQQPGSAYAPGTIVEVLGPPSSVDVQMRLVIEKFHLPHQFSEEALHDADACSAESSDPDRLDLRELLHVTIDGETAKDFDDAICVIKNRKGYRLYVSIADVSHFVEPGSALDKDAYQRGTSIYFPGRVIPMLPENLSNNLCSLIPDEDRLAFTAILDFDREGKLLQKDFTKSVIKSHKRFTYTTVQQIIIDKDPEERRNHKPFLTMLKWAQELAEQLLLKRMNRGSIGFNLPEPAMDLLEDGKIACIEKTTRLFSHQLIEEFMLAANEAVASYFTETSTPSLYRIHELPSPEKVKDFITFAKTMGINLPEEEISPAWFAKILTDIKDSPKEYVFNNLLLRTMQQARYAPGNAGHFGLAATDYTHFTSPIRRYPDLHVHRTLARLLKEKKKGIRFRPISKEKLQESGIFLSSRERTAIDAERDIHNRLKVYYMEQFIGDSFEGIISGVTGSALFVEIFSPFVSGSVDLEELQDDIYLYDSRRHQLIGDVGLKTYQIGDLITVKLIGIDKVRYRINFTVA